MQNFSHHCVTSIFCDNICKYAGWWEVVDGVRQKAFEMNLWIRDSWLNLSAERWGSGSLKTSEGLQHPLSNINFFVYTVSAGLALFQWPLLPSNLTGITKGTAHWESTGLQVTGRRDVLPQTQWKISADGSGALLKKRDPWDHEELLSLHISPVYQDDLYTGKALAVSFLPSGTCCQMP